VGWRDERVCLHFHPLRVFRRLSVFLPVWLLAARGFYISYFILRIIWAVSLGTISGVLAPLSSRAYSSELTYASSLKTIAGFAKLCFPITPFINSPRRTVVRSLLLALPSAVPAARTAVRSVVIQDFGFSGTTPYHVAPANQPDLM
jgi:hypothetical protein